jgi:uncharacterized protein YodC (DUF2158 family)
MKKFKEGDRVRHKSGTGTTMVVKGYSEWTGEVICTWFDTDKKEELFEEEELELEKKNSQRHEQGFKKVEEAPKPKKEIGF